MFITGNEHENKLNKKGHLFPKWLRILLIILFLFGMFFRFSNLDTKVYWTNESITSLRISGYTFTEVISQLYDGRELNTKDIQKYLHPNSEKVLSDTIKSLATEDSQHSPLYYVLARFWAQGFGSSIPVMRILPNLISLLAFPCLYWLCIELFESALVGWVAIAMTSVSLLHVIYAQEARQYSLWMLTSWLSSAVLLRALREFNLPFYWGAYATTFYWGAYATTLALGFYTFPLTGLVGIAHGIYVFVIERCRLSRTIIYYLISAALALIAFIPWILVMFSSRNSLVETTAWITTPKIPLLKLAAIWLDHTTLIVTTSSQLSSVVLITILIGYSIYYIIRKAPQRVWLFVLTLIIIPALGLILPDLILGGVRSSAGRYQIPSYLGMQLAVAYLFANQITSFSIKPWQRKLWQILMIALIFLQIRICFKYYQSHEGWTKNDNYNPPMAYIINQSKKPVVVSDLNKNPNIGSVLSLSYYLDSHVKLQLVVQPNMPNISSNFSDIFLYSPSENLRSGIENKYSNKAVLVYKDHNPINQNPATLWKLKKS